MRAITDRAQHPFVELAYGKISKWETQAGMPNLPKQLLCYARELRQYHTGAEKLLWQLLRNRQVLGFKFRRQHVIAPYIADFYCHEVRLIIEADGGQHAENTLEDNKRSCFFRSRHLTILRFWNHEILQETEAVLEAIAEVLLDQG